MEIEEKPMSKTRAEKIEVAKRHLEHAFKRLDEAGCSVFFGDGCVDLYDNKKLPFDLDGREGWNEQPFATVSPECDSDSGGY